MRRKLDIVCLLALVMFVFSCEGTMSTPIKVSRHAYTPRLDQAKFAEYRGQTIIFDSIDSQATNVTNFYYFSPDREYAYHLFYSPSHMQQPLASFFWYALEKTFTSVGLVVKDIGPVNNAPQIHVKIVSLSDQEGNFVVSISRNGYLILQKPIVFTKKLPPTKDVAELERRQYDFLDLMGETILSDPDFKREFFSEKGKVN